MKLVKKMLGLLLVAVLALGLVAGLGYEEVSAAAKPGKPVIKLSETGEYGEVKITIEKTSNADGYRIFYKGQDDKSYTKLTEISQDGSKKRTYTAKNLESGVYSFRVRAYSKKSGKKVWGSFSKVVKIEVVDAATRAHDDRMHELAAEQYPDLYALVEDGKMGLTMTDDSFIYFTFGSYDMVDRNGNYDDKKETIEWIVVDYDEDEGKALLLSRYVVDTMPYNDSTKSITWENCTLRSWLNESFLYKAFNKEEQKLIINSELRNHDYNSYEVSGGNDTKDRVFILSSDEYKVPSSQRIGRLFDYKAVNWWLRTPGHDSYTAYYVNTDGTKTAGLYGVHKHSSNTNVIDWAYFEGVVSGDTGYVYKDNYNYYITVKGTKYRIFNYSSSKKENYVKEAYVDGVRPAIWVDLTQE